jgi:hypothetical protein
MSDYWLLKQGSTAWSILQKLADTFVSVMATQSLDYRQGSHVPV